MNRRLTALPGVLAGLSLIALTAAGEPQLTAKIATKHRIVRTDSFYGFDRTVFDFDGYEAWVVEPKAGTAREGRPWTWTMQWATAFVPRTGVPQLLAEGYHHVTIVTYKDKMDETGLAVSAKFQKYLVGELGLSPKADLIGMSWGGFYSTRYAARYPSNVDKIYLDAPLLCFKNFNPAVEKADAGYGPWVQTAPADGKWSHDPRMPINLAEKLAATEIPVFLVYGGQDRSCPPERNAMPFIERFRQAGGAKSLKVLYRSFFGHHPHGFDVGDRTVVDFFEKPFVSEAKAQDILGEVADEGKYTALDPARQVRQYVRKDGVVVTRNLADCDFRMADSYVLPAHGERVDYRKKAGRKNTYDAGKGDAMPWTVPAADTKRFAELGRRTPLAKPSRPRRVLLVAKAFGFSHTESLVWGTEAFRAAAEATGFATVDVTDDVSLLEKADVLSRYDAVLLNNVTTVPVAKFPKLLETMSRFVEGGKGLCLIHSAVDSFNDSPGMQCLCGGHFGGHPWYYTGMWAFLNERPDAAVMKTMPKGVSHYSDEIYEQQTPPFSRATCDVLLSLDLSDKATKAAADRWGASKAAEKMPLRPDNDYAVSWTKRVGAGRVFYTSFGHDSRAFFDPDRFGHMLLGLQYCLGD